MRATRGTPAYRSLGIVFADRGSMRKPRRSRGKRCALRRILWPYANLANNALGLQRFDEARQIIHEAQARKLDDFMLRKLLSMLWPFSARTPRRWRNSNSGLRGKPDMRTLDWRWHPTPRRMRGHLGKARELTKRAVDSAIRADSKESGAILSGECCSANKPLMAIPRKRGSQRQRP